MTTRTKQVLLQNLIIFTGPEPAARRIAYDVVLEIGRKHTRPYRASQAFVTASALAILRGGADDFTPETPRSPWTVRLLDAPVAERRTAA